MTLQDRNEQKTLYIKRYAEAILLVLKENAYSDDSDLSHYSQLRKIIKIRATAQCISMAEEEITRKIEDAAFMLARIYLDGREVFSSLYSKYLFDMIGLIVTQKLRDEG